MMKSSYAFPGELYEIIIQILMIIWTGINEAYKPTFSWTIKLWFRWNWFWFHEEGVIMWRIWMVHFNVNWGVLMSRNDVNSTKSNQVWYVTSWSHKSEIRCDQRYCGEGNDMKRIYCIIYQALRWVEKLLRNIELIRRGKKKLFAEYRLNLTNVLTSHPV